MNINEMYGYLVRARRELWAALEATPDPLLSQPLLDGERFHCLKDLVFHIAVVEDSWLHEDILRDEPVFSGSAFKDTQGRPEYEGFALGLLLDYWHAVEKRTLEYLIGLTAGEQERVLSPHDDPEQHYTVKGILWHVMLHEVRHTAQICVLLRTQGIKPPALDLLWYLPKP
jgi:uncharacterized damage-inducible protein DinB